MNSSLFAFRHTALALLACTLCAHAEESAPAPTQTPAAPPPAKPTTSIRYRPPVSGAPMVRGTGGTRGGGNEHASLYVLAPEHEGRTSLAQPALFWFQSAPAKADFEVTLTEAHKAQPLLDLKGGEQRTAGIHSVSLAAHHISLEPNVPYRWSVALVVDPRSRSKDILATGIIRRVPAPAEVTAKLQKAGSPAERAAVYAEAGLWYDALQALSQGIAADPKNASLRRLRVSLLEQGKLKEAATFAAR